ncbi:McrB family protein [Sulfitobacter sp.]|uniref:McrB family protein n=1 Tax=Sulfitobacter sp. TaxID=1903071 RepID=UPI003EF3F037
MPDAKILPDMAEVIENCKKKIDAIDTSLQVTIDPQKAKDLVGAYKELNPKHSIELVGGHSFVIGTGEQTRHISIQEMTTLSVLAENLRALETYRVSLDDIAHDMGFSSRVGEGSQFFGAMPGEDWQSNTTKIDTDKFFDSLKNVFEDQQNRERILKFVSDPDWSGMRKDDGTIGRKLNRSTDWQESAILKTGALVAAASAGRVNLIRAIEQAGFGADLIEVVPPSPSTATSAIIGENVIFYGAPGTGKSNRVKKIVEDAGKEPIRTVFHPDLQNSDFFGCLKPRMDGKNVRYEFAPGPFMEALAEAYEKPAEPVYLVIEELNRAAAAAVFGDLFLLLDREDSGASEYSVTFPSPESRAWVEGKTGTAQERIELPSNLFIYATMNSADQGVYPIDTAFRRRWRQEYLPLDYTKGPDGAIAYIDADGKTHGVEWRGFVEVLNNYLVGNHTLAIAEDRLLGQWFVKKKELNGASIPEKILLYLWDDLLRHEGRDQIFNTGTITTYGALDKAATDGTRFLSSAFLDVLNAISKAEPESADADDAG